MDLVEEKKIHSRSLTYSGAMLVNFRAVIRCFNHLENVLAPARSWLRMCSELGLGKTASHTADTWLFSHLENHKASIIERIGINTPQKFTIDTKNGHI